MDGTILPEADARARALAADLARLDRALARATLARHRPAGLGSADACALAAAVEAGLEAIAAPERMARNPIAAVVGLAFAQPKEIAA